MSTGVSLMVNGVCCVYQMQGEKDLRNAMRSDIREEWRTQREIEAKTKHLQYDEEVERLRMEYQIQRHQVLEASKNHRLRRKQHLVSMNEQEEPHWSILRRNSLTKNDTAQISLFDLDDDDEEEEDQEENHQDGSM